MRNDFDLPEATEKWGWKYHHLGIPTTSKFENEKYIPHLKFYVSGFPDSPYGVEWMRFEDDCPMPEIIKTIPHLAFVVDDLDAELDRKAIEVLVAPNEPSDGVRVAMILHNGAPIELMEYIKPEF